MKKQLDIQVPLNEESPLQRYYDQFDIEHINWTTNDYKLNALQMPIETTNQLLKSEFQWRKDHQQNVVASMEGPQGKGKSMPFSYLGLLLGNIFGVPFTPNDIHFSPGEFEQAFEKSIPCQTILKDEDPKTRVGMMSHMIDTNITDFEEQSRLKQNNLLQAGVELRSHAHFFWFESKHTIFDENAYPKAFISILKTPRYTDRHEFVWRGLARFPMVNNEFAEAYLKRKEAHLSRLKAKYGNTLNPVSYFADKIFNKRKEALTVTTREGFIKPIQKHLMDFVVAEEIGTTRFTMPGYQRLNALIREKINKEYETQNSEILAALESQKKILSQKRQEQREREMELAELKKQERMKFMQEKLEEEKRKNDLKERSIKLKEKILEEQASESLK